MTEVSVFMPIIFKISGEGLRTISICLRNARLGTFQIRSSRFSRLDASLGWNVTSVMVGWSKDFILRSTWKRINIISISKRLLRRNCITRGIIVKILSKKTYRTLLIRRYNLKLSPIRPPNSQLVHLFSRVNEISQKRVRPPKQSPVTSVVINLATKANKGPRSSAKTTKRATR